MKKQEPEHRHQQQTRAHAWRVSSFNSKSNSKSKSTPAPTSFVMPTRVLSATISSFLALAACSPSSTPSDGGAPGGAQGSTGGNQGTGGSGTGGKGSGTGGSGNGGRGGNGAANAGANGQLGGRSGNATGGSPGNGTCATGTPSPAANGVAFPFPQHRAKAGCVYPTSCQDSVVQSAWVAYGKKFIVDGGNDTLRVQRTENENDTVSEGMAYGMLFAATMNDKTTFDKLFQYVQAHSDKHGLMNWRIGAGGNTIGGNSATDADEDIAFALVMADKQWGGYTTTAKDYIGKVAANDFTTDGTIRGGDEYNNVNPSYLAPAFYRTFAAYTGDKKWNTILEKSYQILSSTADGTTGLVPDWQGQDGYGYDAARTPYRVALDACWNGEERAKSYSTKIAAFFAKMGAAGIRDGYKINGTVTGQYNNATFVGPAGVSGMAGNQQVLVNEVYGALADIAAKADDNYYNTSWAFFTVLMMTGNFLDFTNP